MYGQGNHVENDLGSRCGASWFDMNRNPRDCVKMSKELRVLQAFALTASHKELLDVVWYSC